MSPRFGRQLKSLLNAATRVNRFVKELKATTNRPSNKPKPRPNSGLKPCAADEYLSKPYPGDFRGEARIQYSPVADSKPDPGEIVWTWVPYEEDHCQGKDRPVLLVGRHHEYLLAVMLTAKDRNNDHTSDPDYVDIGSGAWDPKGRPSEVKLDRVIQVLPEDVRRNGAVLDKSRFTYVEDRLENLHGWTR